MLEKYLCSRCLHRERNKRGKGKGDQRAEFSPHLPFVYCHLHFALILLSFSLSLSFFLERKESREPIECLVTVFKVRVEFRRLLRGQNGRMFGIEIDPYFPRYTQNKFYALNDQRQDYIRIQDLKRYRNENYFISVSENVFEYNCIRTASPSKRKFFCSRDSKKRSNDALESN